MSFPGRIVRTWEGAAVQDLPDAKVPIVRALLKSALGNRQTADLWAAKGRVEFAAGDVRSAEYAFRSALQMDASHAVASKNLPRVLSGGAVQDGETWDMAPAGSLNANVESYCREVSCAGVTAALRRIATEAGGGGASQANILRALIDLVRPRRVIAMAGPGLRDEVRSGVAAARHRDPRYRPVLVALDNGDGTAAPVSAWYNVPVDCWVEALAKLQPGDMAFYADSTPKSAGFFRSLPYLSAGIWVWVDLTGKPDDAEVQPLRSALAAFDQLGPDVLAGCLTPGPQPQQHLSSPVFVHAMWRTGSTYFWNKFRRQSCYRAFYEPFHEELLTLTGASRDDPAVLDSARALGHPALHQPYFAEYPLRAGGGVPELTAELCYRRYCLDPGRDDAELTRYMQRLLLESAARNYRPVLQCNRSLLRIGWLRRRFRGLHILLLRNPREVWRSFRQHGPYFAGAICLIVGKNSDHRWIGPLALAWSVPFFEGANLRRDFDFYTAFAEQLGNRRGYGLFHAFYLLTAIAGFRDVDLVVDMDAIASMPSVRARVEQRLAANGIQISLEDCKPPALVGDGDFFDRTESDNVAFLEELLSCDIRMSPASANLELLGPGFRDVVKRFISY